MLFPEARSQKPEISEFSLLPLDLPKTREREQTWSHLFGT